jgi:uncharacterized protein YneF (UPF0154 family)
MSAEKVVAYIVIPCFALGLLLGYIWGAFDTYKIWKKKFKEYNDELRVRLKDYNVE